MAKNDKSLKRQLVALQSEVTTNREVATMQKPAVNVLSSGSNYEVWKSLIRNELRGLQYDYMIDPEKPEPLIDTQERERRAGFVCSYVMNRIAIEYQSILCTITDPRELMKKLEELRRPTFLSNRFNTKRKWNALVFQKGKESVLEFIHRFEELVREYESFDSLTELQKTENFLMALGSGDPELERKFDEKKMNSPLTDLKVWALNEEARENETSNRRKETMDSTGAEINLARPEERGTNKRDEGRRGARPAGRTRPQKRSYSQSAGRSCRNCGKQGHLVAECYSEAHVCYNCKRLTKNPNHIGSTCWLPEESGYENKVHGSRGGIRGRGQPRSRARGRGFQRGGRNRGRFFRRGRGRGEYYGQSPLKRGKKEVHATDGDTSQAEAHAIEKERQLNISYDKDMFE